VPQDHLNDDHDHLPDQTSPVWRSSIAGDNAGSIDRIGTLTVLVALDIRPALTRGTGVGTFVEQLAVALDDLDVELQMRLFTSSAKERWDPGRLSDLKRSTIIDRRWPVRVLNGLWHRVGWPPVDRFVGRVDIAHSPTPLLMPTRGRKIVTLHDLYFLTHPEHTRAEIRRDYAPLVRRHVAAADAVLSVSQSTANAAMEHLDVPGERIRICGEDAAPIYDEPARPEELADVDRLVGRPFFLYVGTIEPRKNLPALLEAFDLFCETDDEAMLVIAGERGWGTSAFDDGLRQLRSRSRVWISGYRDQRFLRALYHRATGLVMPSRCEGFGLPLVEAMACGCPLLVADNTALPEVAGDAALYWSSDDPEDLAGLMAQLRDDETLRAQLVANGKRRRTEFSWRRSAERVYELYRDLVS